MIHYTCNLKNQIMGTKTFPVTISEEAHKELLKIQFERKMNGDKRNTVRDVASDVLEKCLLKK